MSESGRSQVPRILEDPVTGELVLCAPERAKRPRKVKALWPPSETTCDFCEGNESHTTREVFALRSEGSAPDGPGWRVRIVDNLYPAVARGGGEPRGAPGVHEVLIEGPAHTRHPTEIGEELMGEVLLAAASRLHEISRVSGVRSVFLFKNVGPQAGASMEHSHWQILGLPVLPPRILREAEGAARFRRGRGLCVFCSILADSQPAGRLVAATGRFAILCPPAPRFPFESWILPLQHETEFPRDSDSLRELAAVYLHLMRGLDSALSLPPLNIYLHHGPFAETNPPLHWHLEVIPRHVGRASLEIGAELPINSVAPEEAAARLRALAP